MSGGPASKQTVPINCTGLGAYKIAPNAYHQLALPGLILLDTLAILFSILVAYLIRIYVFPFLLPGVMQSVLLANTLHNLWWLPLVFLSCMAYEDLYQKRLPFWVEVEKTLKACSLAVIFTISLLYLAKMSGEISRSLVIITWALVIIIIPLFRYVGKLTLMKAYVWNKPIIILGAGKTGELIVRALTREKTMGYDIVGFLDDNKELTEVTNPITKKAVPILGSFADAERIISYFKVKEVIVAAPGIPSRQLVELTNRLQPLINNVMLVPDLFGLSMNGIEVEYFFEEQALLLNVKNKLKSNINRSIKRIFDIIIGSLLLIICLPLMFFISVCIKIDSKGPSLFFHERMGQGGSKFTCFKFRTMFIKGDKLLKRHLRRNKQAREEWTIYKKLRSHDPRVTRIGTILRKFSLDELPQLINVILGDMSLVGPRPYLPRETDQMDEWLYDIQLAKPGITGLWQVSGRNEIDFEGRLKLDVWYVRNWSLWLDIVLMLKTIKVVIKREGAY